MAVLHLALGARNALAERLRDLIDAAGSPGTIRFYDGAMPADADARTSRQTLLAKLTFSYPCAKEAEDGTVNFLPVEEESNAPARGRATWARVEDGDGNHVMDCDVTDPGGGGIVEINTVEIVKDGPVRMSNFAINFPAE